MPTTDPLPDTRGRLTPRMLVYAAIVVAIGYVALMLNATDGHVVAQVSDLYVVLQYARAFAEGHPFRYNAGEAPSTGSTSLLYTAGLGLAHAVGIRGEWLVAFAIALGAGFYAMTVALAVRVARRLGSEQDALLAGGLNLLGGPVVWGFLYGSDIAPFMFLSLWLFERLLARSYRGAALVGVLLSLARPEGLVVGLIVLAAAGMLWPDPRRARLWLILPVVTGGTVLVLYRLVSGYWVSTSVVDKSLLANYSVADALALSTEYLTDVLRGLLMGLYPAQVPIGFAQGWASLFFAPLSLILILIAVTTASEAARSVLYMWGAAIAVVFLGMSLNMYMGVHFSRYLMWAFPSLLVLVAVGFGAITRRLAADPAVQNRIFRTGAVFMLVLGALSTARFAAMYGQLSGDMYRRDVAAAEWVVRHLPPDAVIANVATSVDYLTGRRGLNLHGVMTPAFFGNLATEREAGVFESLGHLSTADRPTHVMATVALMDSEPYLRELVVAPELYRTTSFGDEIVVYKFRPEAVAKNRGIGSPAALHTIAGLVRVDELNVCDRRSEKAHGYEFRSGRGDLRLYGTVRIARYEEAGASADTIADAGRAILGHESFDIATVPGHSLVIVARTAADVDVVFRRATGPGRTQIQVPEAAVRIRVDGRMVEDIHFRPRSGWDEQVWRIDGSEIRSQRTHLDLSGEYCVFYYWFFQAA